MPSSSKTGPTSGPTGPVTEEEIRAVLLQNGPVTTQDLVARFKSRLRTPEVCSALALCKPASRYLAVT
jgi:transcription initiation factor TFIIF subunit alpha